MHCGGKGHILSRGIVFADAEKRTLAAIVPIYDAGIPRYHKYCEYKPVPLTDNFMAAARN